MADILLAWRNIWRNVRRSLLTISAIAFACGLLVFMLSFQFGTYEEMINASVKQSTGHIQILGKGYKDQHRMYQVVKNPKDIIEKLHLSGDVSAVTSRSEAFVIAQGESRTSGAMLTGVDSVAEESVSNMSRKIIRGKYLSITNDLIVGSLLAQKLKIDVGSELTVLGQGRDGSVAAAVLHVCGIFDAGFEEYNRNVIMMDINEFDQIFYMDGAVHRLVIMADSFRDINKIEGDVATFGVDGVEVYSWDELQPGLRQSIELDLVSGFVMYAVLIIVVAFSVLNTFLMTILERTKEFGVLMSLGTRPVRLIKVVMLEAMLITAIGLAVGIIIGGGVSLYYEDAGIVMQGMEMMEQYGFSGSLHPKLSLISASIGPAIIGFVTFFAAFIPALRISGMKPVRAMRGER